MSNESFKLSYYRWPAIIVGLLVGHVVLMMFCVSYAVQNHTTAGVTPDYYNKALHWDESRQQQRVNAELGWRVTLTPAVFADVRGQRDVLIQVIDDQGKTIRDAEVTLDAYHAVYPKVHADHAQATDAGDEGYRAVLKLNRGGLWRVTVRVQRGDERFVQTMDQRIATVELEHNG